MRAFPAIDLARPTNVCCIAIPSSLGRLTRSLYLLVERGVARSTGIGYFFEAKLQGRVGFFRLAMMFRTGCRQSGSWRLRPGMLLLPTVAAVSSLHLHHPPASGRRTARG